MIEGVPLGIGGSEAQHSAELFRLKNWMDFRGQEGWLTSTAGRCETRLTPGQGVRLLPGPFVINSRYPGGEMQSYLDRIIDSHDVPVTTVPPGGGRSDLIVVNVRDPHPDSGTVWAYPTTDDARRHGPYVFAEVVEGVPPGTVSLEQLNVGAPQRGWTAIASARLDRPGNTGTVTNDMIKRCNVVCNPLVGIQLPQEVIDNLSNNISDVMASVNGIAQGRVSVPGFQQDVAQGSAGGSFIDWNQLSLKDFPAASSGFVIVPTWATYASILVINVGLLQSALVTGNAQMDLYSQVRFGTGLTISPYTAQFLENISPALRSRVNLVNAYEMYIQPADRGKKLPWSQRMLAMAGSSGRGRLQEDLYSSTFVQIRYKETPYGA